MEKLRPLDDRLLVVPLKRDEKSAGGIIIPETAADTNQAWQGEVLAVGNGKLLEDGSRATCDVKPGAVVLVSKFSGTKVEIDGREARVVRFDDVLGEIEKV